MTLMLMCTSRCLAPSETLADVLQQHGEGVILHALSIQSDIRISQELLNGACSKLSQSQTALRMCINKVKMKSGGELRRFEEMPPEGLANDVSVVRTREEMAWTKIAREEMKSGFTKELCPLWKMIYVETIPVAISTSISRLFVQNASAKSSHYTARSRKSAVRRSDMSSVRSEPRKSYSGTILLKIHPSIADSVSVHSLLIGQLVPLLENCRVRPDLSRPTGEVFEFPDVVPLILAPAVDDSFLLNNSLPKWIKKTVILQQEPYVKKIHSASKGGSASTTKNGPAMCMSSLSADLSSNLLEESAMRAVTVRSIVVTAACLALSSLVHSESSLVLASDTIVCGVPFDLRPTYSLFGKPEPLGRWEGYTVITLKNEKRQVPPQKFWSIVQAVSDQLELDEASENFDVFSLYDEMVEKLKEDCDNAQVVAENCLPLKAHLEVSVLSNSNTEMVPRYGIMSSASSMLSSTTLRKSARVESVRHFQMSSMGSRIRAVPLKLCVSAASLPATMTLVYDQQRITEKMALAYLDCLYANLSKILTSRRDTLLVRLPPAVLARTLSSQATLTRCPPLVPPRTLPTDGNNNK